MPRLGNLKVWIEVGGIALDEYGVQVGHRGENTQAVCWVACETGTKFKLGVSRHGSLEENYVFSVSVDGTIVHPLHGRPVLRSHDQCDAEKPRYFEGLKEQGSVRPFEFSALRLTDDDQYLASEKPSLGQIALTIFSYVGIVDGPGPTPTTSTDLRREAESLMQDAVLHEKTKKGLQMCVRLGERKVLATSVVKGTAAFSAPGATKPQRHFIGWNIVGEVVFKYRDLGTLMADGIVPCAQRPKLPPVNPIRKSDTMENLFASTTEDLNRLRVGILSLQASERRSRKMNAFLVATILLLVLFFSLSLSPGYVVKV